MAEIRTLGELAAYNAAVRPGREALWFEGRSTSYAEFERQTNRVANGLLAEGVRHGGRVGIIDKNSDLFFQVLFGCAKIGAVPFGVNWRLAPPEVAYILNDSRTELLLVGPDFFELVKSIAARIPTLRRIVALPASPHQAGNTPVAAAPEWTAFETWRDRQSDTAPAVKVTADDICVQLYTSGTTGNPKGVQLAHRVFFDMKRHAPAPDMAFEQWTENDVSLVAMPGFHIGGVGWGVAGLRAGARNIVIREFDPQVVLEMIGRFGISKLFMVPAAMRMVLKLPQARTTPYGSLKYMLYGASPIPLDLLREAIEVFKCGFVQLYGMTETTGGATYLPPQDHDVAGNERMRSAGKAYPGVAIKVVDRELRELPPRTLGEICIRSPANMSGYWNLPEATAQALIDGYVHTGDMGYLDEDGYVYVLDRARDMIISGGVNIRPAEVEAALESHPAVAEAAVIGVADERWGEAVKAIVVKRPGHDVSAEELIAHARQRIGGYKLPKSVDFIDQLPRNPAGKILRRELRKRY
jgi:acyl-CoA synthetase (AMP-forming)/AMP-acid ligase II